MKKFLIIAGITLAVIFVLLITLPFLFQGKIKDFVIKEANKQLNATLSVGDVNLSFIRNFPNATISLEDLMLTGVDDFASDTLLQSEELSATVNLKSIFGDTGGYDVKKIDIKNTFVHAKVLENGKANWDIMKVKEDEQKAAEDTASVFNLQLQKITIDNMNVVYDDLQSKMKMEIKDLSGTLKGDMTADLTTIETVSSIEELTFIMDKIPYLNKAKIATDLALSADLKNQKYTIEKSTLDINAIHAKIDGWLAIPDTSRMEMDLKVEAPELQFKDLLSLIPAIYAKDFQDLKAEGDVKLLATAKGVMQGDSYPAFDVQLDVANGMFQYPALPKSLNDIQLSTHISSPGGILDNMLVDISKLHFNLGGNPFDVRLKVSHPMTDPFMDLTANGKLNLGMIREIYPLDKGMELNGELDANVNFTGAMSSIEKGAYDNFKASGTLGLKGMKFKSEGIPDVMINSAMLAFNPKYAELSRSDIRIGKNDIAVGGKLENYIPYFMKDQTLRGSLDVSSNYLNLNDFMKEGGATESQGATSSTLAFEVPKNLDLNMTANLKEVVFEKINMQNVAGNIAVNNGKIDMKNLSMNALGGSMKVNGYYSTAANPKQPDVSMGLDMKNVSFSETYKSFDFVKELAPIFENMLGNYSVNFNMKTPLSADMSPILTALTGSGTLASNDVTISNVPVLNALAGALKNESLKTIKPKDMKIPFNIANGRVSTTPFDINLGGVSKMNLSGSTGLDQTIDYVAKVNVPSSLTKGMLNNVNVKIGGTFTSPKVSLDAADLLGQAAGSLLGGLGVPGLTDSLGNVDVKGAANAEIEKQAAALRKQAQDAGAQLVSEAEKQGQRLIDEANKTKNPLAKVAAVAAAQSAAGQLKVEAQKQSDNLMKEAEKQITDLSNSSKLK